MRPGSIGASLLQLKLQQSPPAPEDTDINWDLSASVLGLELPTSRSQVIDASAPSVVGIEPRPTDDSRPEAQGQGTAACSERRTGTAAYGVANLRVSRDDLGSFSSRRTSTSSGDGGCSSGDCVTTDVDDDGMPLTCAAAQQRSCGSYWAQQGDSPRRDRDLQPLRALRQQPMSSTATALLGRLGPGCDLGADDENDGLAAQRKRDLAQIERVRDAVRETLLAKKLLDPHLCGRPLPPPPFLTPNQQQHPQPAPAHQHPPRRRGAASNASDYATPAATCGGVRHHSQPQVDFPYLSSTFGAAGGGLAACLSTFASASGIHNSSGPAGQPRPLRPPGARQHPAGHPSAASAPSSPMAAAAARRRQLMLDAHVTAAGPSGHIVPAAVGTRPWDDGVGRMSPPGPGPGLPLASACWAGWRRKSAGAGCSANVSVSGSSWAGASAGGLGGGGSVISTPPRAPLCAANGGGPSLGLGGDVDTGRSPVGREGGKGKAGEAAAVGGGDGCDGCDVAQEEGEEGGGLGEGDEEEEEEEDDMTEYGNVVDLGTLVRNERRRLSMVQSKVTGMLRSQKRYQGLLANCPGGLRSLTLTVEELTASVIPTPAKPPEGVELKVRADDIRFSGVRLGFLVGLLEALEQHPEPCRDWSTSDLVTHLVLPLTAPHRCRLLDLIPHQHRGQPHHYISHAWTCNVREMLHTLRTEMLPQPPPRQPAAMGEPAAEVAQGRTGSPAKARAQPLRPAGLGAGDVGKDGGWAGGGGVGTPRKAPGGLGPAAHLPQLGGKGGCGGSGTGVLAAAPHSVPANCGPSAPESVALHDADIGPGPGAGQGSSSSSRPSVSLPSIGAGAGHTQSGEGAASTSVSAAGDGDLLPPADGGRSAKAAWQQLYESYKKELSAALDQVVWIDVVCNNQHSQVKKDYGKVAKTVVGCGATVLVLDPQLTALSRTWCLFEVMHCLRCKRHLKVFRAQQPERQDQGHAQATPAHEWHPQHRSSPHPHPHPPAGLSPHARGAPAKSLGAGAGAGQPAQPRAVSEGGATGRSHHPHHHAHHHNLHYHPVRPHLRHHHGVGAGASASSGDAVPRPGGLLSAEELRWDRAVETISIADSRATCEQDRVGILQEVLTTVGTAYVDDLIRGALRLSNAERARQLALRRQQLRTTLELLQPDPAVIGTEEYESNLTRCREHLTAVLEQFYPADLLRCIIPRDYVSDSARCWDMLCIFAEILDRELFREDAKALRGMAWLIFKRHSKRYIDVLYEKELQNWLVDSLERDRKWRRTQAKLKHDAQKKWN